ncbi:DUF485 domain-containing protein [Nakamurella sp. UYEF19]|uniref:DUF485 domain-containing protein n=1 Tax=Nakamurella sp. UYEF19 TaxID=1756392 RepID=UPI003395C08A
MLGDPTQVEWEEIQRSSEFLRLRKALRSFIFPMTAAFLAWYLLYVLCAAYARGFMNVKVFGNVTLGLLFGLLQFASTFVIAILYARYANRKFDPLADELRNKIEGETR